MKLKICAAQMAPNSESKGINISRMIGMMEKAKNEGAGLIAFPELALTPFFPVKYIRHFHDYCVSDDSPEIIRLRDAAKKIGIVTLFGYAELEKSNYYNSAIILNKEGNIAGKYRKTHIPCPMISEQMGNYEKVYFSSGNLGYPVIDIDGLRIGLQICYDRHFPEGYRALALKGADIVFNLTATTALGSDWRSEMWSLLLRARAFENSIFVVGVNKTGLEYGKDYYGNSMIISPLGAKVVAFCDTTEEDFPLYASIDTDDLLGANLRLPFRRDLLEQERNIQ